MDTKTLRIRASDAPIGAVVTGIDLAGGIDATTFGAIDAALNQHSVIVLRNQNLTPEQFAAFTRRFGDIEINAFNDYALNGHPEILVISNVVENGRNIGYADAGSHWHSDMSYTATPPNSTLLYAIEVPEKDGQALGDTLFASTAAAYEALSDEMKRRLEGLKAVHRFSAKPRGTKQAVKLTETQVERYPDVVHPVVRTHPVTRRKCIYVREGECVGIVGMPDAESLPLIKQLSDHCIRPAFVYRNKWRGGDLLIWDNRAVQHLAVHDYALPQRRLMYRTTVSGAAPF
jgi:taurine dioxygenase